MTDNATATDEDFGKLHPEAFAAGRDAFRTGATRRSNPIRGDSEKRLAWFWGYSEALDETLPDEDGQPTVTVGELVEHLTRLYSADALVHLTEAEHRNIGPAPAAVCLDVALRHIRGMAKGSSI